MSKSVVVPMHITSAQRRKLEMGGSIQLTGGGSRSAHARLHHVRLDARTHKSLMRSAHKGKGKRIYGQVEGGLSTCACGGGARGCSCGGSLRGYARAIGKEVVPYVAGFAGAAGATAAGQPWAAPYAALAATGATKHAIRGWGTRHGGIHGGDIGIGGPKHYRLHPGTRAIEDISAPQEHLVHEGPAGPNLAVGGTDANSGDFLARYAGRPLKYSKFHEPNFDVETGGSLDGFVPVSHLRRR